MASHTNPSSTQLLHAPSNTSIIPLLLLLTSPFFKLSTPGTKPGFFTINAINSPGSPPIEKNSTPGTSSTKDLKTGWVAIRTRCPCVWESSEARDKKGWMSPREPMSWITMLSLGREVSEGGTVSAGVEG